MKFVDNMTELWIWVIGCSFFARKVLGSLTINYLDGYDKVHQHAYYTVATLPFYNISGRLAHDPKKHDKSDAAGSQTR